MPRAARVTPLFNHAQQEIIDRIERYSEGERVSKRMIRSAFMSCREVGPEISALEIGKYV